MAAVLTGHSTAFRSAAALCASAAKTKGSCPAQEPTSRLIGADEILVESSRELHTRLYPNFRKNQGKGPKTLELDELHLRRLTSWAITNSARLNGLTLEHAEAFARKLGACAGQMLAALREALVVIQAKADQFERLFDQGATMRPVAQRLRGIPGIDWFLGLSLAAEIGDINRSPSARICAAGPHRPLPSTKAARRKSRRPLSNRMLEREGNQ